MHQTTSFYRNTSTKFGNILQFIILSYQFITTISFYNI
nr:MAG TPA_asm: hypothetical protein [Caudoviricetes sp.]